MKPQELQELLTAEFNTWRNELSPNPRLRRVIISSSKIQRIYDENLGAVFIQKLKEHLPNALLYCPDDRPLKIKELETQGFGTGVQLYIDFASQELEADDALLEIDANSWLP